VRNIKLTIEYDGTAYSGWQRQENAPTVQQSIEEALRQLTGHAAVIYGAGRTDAGVHARGQVANFHTESELELHAFRNGLNALLNKDVVILEAVEVPPDFHARFSAISRTYSYRIATKPTALSRFTVWFLKYKLDLPLLQTASGYITGEHDFHSFCRSLAEVEHYRCVVREATWIRDRSDLVFTITADRFLHGMVRALVGTMVDIGRGALTVDQFRAVLQSGDRREAGMSAPAAGLVLECVEY
jgi:tRNA pseudouridine38-40 synthase